MQWCAIVALVASPLASAQVIRPLPADLLLGTMTANGGSVIKLGDARVPLSPAAQVRGTDNLIILPASLYGTHRIGYKVDFQGMIHRIWILTNDEYAALTSK